MSLISFDVSFLCKICNQEVKSTLKCTSRRSCAPTFFTAYGFKTTNKTSLLSFSTNLWGKADKSTFYSSKTARPPTHLQPLNVAWPLDRCLHQVDHDLQWFPHKSVKLVYWGPLLVSLSTWSICFIRWFLFSSYHPYLLDCNSSCYSLHLDCFPASVSPPSPHLHIITELWL